MGFVRPGMSVCIIIQRSGRGSVRIIIEGSASWVSRTEERCCEASGRELILALLGGRAGPECPRKHIRRTFCPFYMAGFCPDGPHCTMGQ